MKFFTDRSVVNDYLLIKLPQYSGLKDKDRWKEILVDPGVYDLTKGPTFKWEDKIDVDEFLETLPANHYFSWDYPPDMNLDHTEHFLERTWENALKYHAHPQYIVTVQCRFQDFPDFKKRFDQYNALDIESEFLGIGNMCRYPRMNLYLKNVLLYAFKNLKHPRLHIYGLCLSALPTAFELAEKYDIDFSTDSTKWTRAVTNELKYKYGLNAKRDTRQIFFDAYLERIKEKGIELN